MKIIYLHTNASTLMRNYHISNVELLKNKYGFNVKMISLIDHHPFVYFKKMDVLYKNKDSAYMNYHNFLISEI